MENKADSFTHLPREVSPLAFYAAEIPTFKPVRRSGWVDGGLCPFHANRRPGSFRIHLEHGAFICFACGTKGSDIISFVQQRDGLPFKAALTEIAKGWGLM